MMKLRTMKSSRNEEYQQDDEDKIPHGTRMIKELVMKWDNTDRIVCADSYFAPVPATE